MKNFPRYIILLTLCFAPRADAETGKNSFETLNLTLPARFFALGGAGAALSDDISSCFINSSRLVFVKSAEFMAGGSVHFDDAFAGFAAAAYPMPLGVFAASILYFDYGAAEIRIEDTLEPDRLWSPKDIIAGLSFGATLFKFFSYGINLKYIQENLSPDETIFAFAADLNTHLDLRFIPGLQASFLVNNLGIIPSGRFKGNPLPLVFVIGVSRPFELAKPVLGLYDIRPVFDVEISPAAEIRLLGGAEWCWYHLLPSTHLIVRTGINWAPGTDPLSLARLGAGVTRKNLAFDYGIGWHPDLGFVHRMNLSFKLTAPPEKRYIRFVSESDLKKDLREIDDAMRSTPTNQTPAPRTDSSVRTPAQEQLKKTPPAPMADDYDFEEE